jgi:hypothetical protein
MSVHNRQVEEQVAKILNNYRESTANNPFLSSDRIRREVQLLERVRERLRRGDRKSAELEFTRAEHRRTRPLIERWWEQEDRHVEVRGGTPHFRRPRDATEYYERQRAFARKEEERLDRELVPVGLRPFPEVEYVPITKLLVPSWRNGKYLRSIQIQTDPEPNRDYVHYYFCTRCNHPNAFRI